MYNTCICNSNDMIMYVCAMHLFSVRVVCVMMMVIVIILSISKLCHNFASLFFTGFIIFNKKYMLCMYMYIVYACTCTCTIYYYCCFIVVPIS